MKINFFYESSKVALTGELVARSSTMMILSCSGDPSDLCCIGKLILATGPFFKIARADGGGLLLDESLSPIGFGGKKVMIQLLRCMTTKHALSMLGHLISVSFNALYAWDRDPRIYAFLSISISFSGIFKSSILAFLLQSFFCPRDPLNHRYCFLLLGWEPLEILEMGYFDSSYPQVPPGSLPRLSCFFFFWDRSPLGSSGWEPPGILTIGYSSTGADSS
nr:hypothetical protein CFP56_31367 [Quercus suber]